VDRLVKRAASLSVGDPAADGTVIGPLINATALNRVSGEVIGMMTSLRLAYLTRYIATKPCARTE
jgi:acyl-CoA reductase-like NAD-dependent aldehyde dehydrogenase